MLEPKLTLIFPLASIAFLPVLSILKPIFASLTPTKESPALTTKFAFDAINSIFVPSSENAISPDNVKLSPIVAFKPIAPIFIKFVEASMSFIVYDDSPIVIV